MNHINLESGVMKDLKKQTNKHEEKINRKKTKKKTTDHDLKTLKSSVYYSLDLHCYDRLPAHQKVSK